MIVVAGDVSRALVRNRARLAREGVPDRRAAAVRVDGAFDLIGGRGGAPLKAAGKAGWGASVFPGHTGLRVGPASGNYVGDSERRPAHHFGELAPGHF